MINTYMRNYINIVEGFLGLPTDKRKVTTLLAHMYDVATVAKLCHCSEEEVLKIDAENKKKGRRPRYIGGEN